jgi:hypothetical protein
MNIKDWSTPLSVRFKDILNIRLYNKLFFIFLLTCQDTPDLADYTKNLHKILVNCHSKYTLHCSLQNASNYVRLLTF